MNDIPRASAVRGKTMRWAWTDGPTKGKVHEHVFHADGNVEWHDAGAPASKSGKAELVPYAAFEVKPDVCAVSYLSKSGFTLTVVLDFGSHRLVGIASSSDQWHPLRGTFEVVR
jgi:hypothetical protein